MTVGDSWGRRFYSEHWTQKLKNWQSINIVRKFYIIRGTTVWVREGRGSHELVINKELNLSWLTILKGG